MSDAKDTNSAAFESEFGGDCYTITEKKVAWEAWQAALDQPAKNTNIDNTLLRVIADIRMKTGVGLVPMLVDLADVLAAKCKAAAQPVERAAISDFLESWIYDGKLQSFESREKFRKEARAILAAQADHIGDDNNMVKRDDVTDTDVGDMAVNDAGIGLDHKPDTLKSGMPAKLAALSRHMEDIAVEMDYFGGFAPWAQHGGELMGAAMMVAEWAEACASTEENPIAAVKRDDVAGNALRAALIRLLACAPEIADATDDSLRRAANDMSEEPMLREQAAAVLQARSAIAASAKEAR